MHGTTLNTAADWLSVHQGPGPVLGATSEADHVYCPATTPMILYLTDSPLSALDGAFVWLNSEPLTAAGLRGQVVLVDFWTYSCVNWLRTLPVRQRVARALPRPRARRRRGARAGVRLRARPRQRAPRGRELGIGYPVVIDNDFAIWRAFDNHYWPALYLVDGDGRVRFHHFGEGAYEETERAIQELLGVDERAGPRRRGGLAEAADWDTLGSPETYVGPARGERRSDRRADGLALNQWALAGGWSVGRGGRRARSGRRRDRLPLPGARPQPGPRAARRGAPVRFAGASTASRPATPMGSTSTIRRGRARRAADVPARPPAWPIRERDLRDHLPRRPGVRAYVFTFG